MKAPAQTIVRDAHILLKDTEGTRWPAEELVSYLNDGQRAIVGRRPDTTATTQTVSLAAGTRQVLPALAQVFMDLPKNAAGRQRAITRVDKNTLDAASPGWQSAPAMQEVRHFMHDLREPRVFYVYPPVRAGVPVDMQYAAYPQDVSAPLGADYSSVFGDCALDIEWSAALLYFVLFRAFGKDAEVGNAATAAAYLDLFKRELGEPLQAASTVSSTA